MVNIHEKYITRCIKLAKNGLGTTYPNPLVGSVITYDDTIIGEGWHWKSGSPHAEVLAIAAVSDKELLKQATIYVNLEPCSHHGKTPPCTDLIIASGIKHVVVGTIDPFAKVAGSGIRKLREAGCTVTVGVLEDRCKVLNRRFFTFHTQKRPYVILKWAASADGFLGSGTTAESLEKATPEWISNSYSRQRVHQWRSQEQAILVGTNTVFHDNPRLNVRDWKGEAPVRIVLDKQLRIPGEYNVWDGSVKTIFISDKSCNTSSPEQVFNEKIDFSGDVARQFCDVLYKHQLQSVIVEGGAQTLQTFINAQLWDEARVFTGRTALHTGIRAPELHLPPLTKEDIAGDLLCYYTNTKS